MSAERLFKILNRLIDKNTCTAQELAEELEVSVRTIYRDIDTLTLSGVPLITTQGKGGGITLLDNHILNKTMLTSFEQDQIITALQGMQGATAHSNELILKLKNLFHKETSDWIEVSLNEWGMTNNYFEILKEAILKKQVVELTYWGTSGNKTVRKIKPAKLVFKGRGWYVQGYCLTRNDYRIFKLVRIEKIEVLDETFTEQLNPPSIESIDITHNKKVILSFDYRVQNRVVEEFDNNQIKYLENEIVVETSFPVDMWLKEYILSFGSAVRVIEPMQMKLEVEKEIKKMMKLINN
ncbi:helix-turn-helix transcriptional regulator [Anaerorhabdus sp.]|jgi:predicted DNA-binding transcriptional regulator YafY|uniref:helix-turn-helix transcriptional regulator n=1 Tax=Anaerorhabdus sp. TaxID=1872524 RepID=UPI002FCAF73E